MKILYVVTQFGVGGAERVLMNLAKEMKLNGHEVYIISLLSISGTEADEVEVTFMDFKSRFFQSFFQLRKLIVQLSPDVIHSHCLHANVIMRLIKLVTPVKKLISSAHSSNEGDGVFMQLYKYTNFLSNINTNVSDAAVKKYIDNGYIKKNKISRVYNVIDIFKYDFNLTSRVKYRKNFELENIVVLISVGSLKDAKDYPTLFRAISLLKIKGITRFKQFIIGSGHLECELKDMVHELDLEQEVVFLGNRVDIQELLSMADILVLSSKYEGLPTVLIEAIMAENLIVSTNCEGASEILNNEKFISPVSDYIKLQENIEKAVELLFDNRKKNYLISQKEFVKEKFSKEKVFKQWLDIYEK